MAINYGYSLIGNHMTVKIRCNLTLGMAQGLRLTYPTLVIEENTLTGRWIVEGVVLRSEAQDFMVDLSMAMRQTKRFNKVVNVCLN